MAMKTIRRRSETKREVVNTENLFNSGCLIHLSVGFWSARAKVKENIYDEEISKDRDILRTVQDLLDESGRKDLKEIQSIYSETYNYLSQNLLPCPIRALKFVPKDRVDAIDDYLQNQRERFKEAVQSFLGNYEQHIKNFQKSKNKRLFRQNKYPTVDRLKTKFYFEWIFRVLNVPSKEQLPNDIYKREVENAKQQMQEIVNMTMEVVKTEFLAKIQKLQEYTSEGKLPKKTINSIGRLFEKYDELWSGFVGADELKSTLEDIRSKVGKINPENESDDYIDSIKKQAKKMAKAIEALPEYESKRALDY
jgi:hypothetical protein